MADGPNGTPDLNPGELKWFRDRLKATTMNDTADTPSAEGIKQNLANTNNWLRLLFILIYALIFWLGAWVLGFVVLLNLLIVLFSGERNRNLVEFGGQLADYLGQLMRYATFNTDVKPFPFGEWSSGAEAATTAPKPAAATPKPKKKATRKKASKKTPPPPADS